MSVSFLCKSKKHKLLVLCVRDTRDRLNVFHAFFVFCSLGIGQSKNDRTGSASSFCELLLYNPSYAHPGLHPAGDLGWFKHKGVISNFEIASMVWQSCYSGDVCRLC